jgi:PAS domain S-box-containing protein
MNANAPACEREGELTALTHRLTTEYAVSRILAEGGEAEESLLRSLEIMGRELQWDFCLCWRLQPPAPPAPPAMRLLASYCSDPERLRAFEAALEVHELSLGQGFAGKAWAAAEPLWIGDASDGRQFLMAEAARRADLGPGVCVPILFRGNVIGLLQFLARRGARPDADSLPVLVSLAEQIGRFLNHDVIESALRASEARFRALFDANVAGVHCSTLEGEPLALNPAFVRMFGFTSREEAMQFPSRELYCDPADREALLEELRRHGRDVNRQLRLRRRDGTEMWVLANTVLIPGREGTPDLNESTVIDITEAKEMEQRQWQTSKMESMGRLAGGIAHDFNNLLTVINGYADLALARLDSQAPARDSIVKLHEAGQRAAGLTRQLLAFSRRQALEPAVVDLEAAVRSTAAMLEGTLGDAMDLRIEVEPGLGKVRADPNQVTQIVMNLAINARDAMPGGGTLLLDLHPVVIDDAYTRRHVQAKQGEYVRLEVSDTGTGMDAATLQHAFEPFYTTKPKGKGTGLGLSTVYGLMLQQGGWVELYSELGRGTTFKLYFPRAEETPAAPAVEEAAPAEGRGESVLVVEDNEEIRALTEEVLRDHGYIVETAAECKQALELAYRQGRRYDLLVTDLVLAGCSGARLAAQMRAAQRHLRVLYLSGFSRQAATTQGLMAPGDRGEFLQKPFTPAVLLGRVRKVLEQPETADRTAEAKA